MLHKNASLPAPAVFPVENIPDHGIYFVSVSFIYDNIQVITCLKNEILMINIRIIFRSSVFPKTFYGT
jgi:hypothetical protein